jgi:predicted PurR-regulated permease PerM
MDLVGYTPTRRTRIFFILIFFVAVLWALFLLWQGYLLGFGFIFAFLAMVNPVVAFIDMKKEEKTRSFFILYLIVLVGLLWASVLMVMGVQIWISLFIFIVCIGIPAFLHIMDTEPAPAKK